MIICDGGCLLALGNKTAITEKRKTKMSLNKICVVSCHKLKCTHKVILGQIKKLQKICKSIKHYVQYSKRIVIINEML